MGETIAVLPCAEAQARRAGVLRIAHYHRERSPLSLADCIALATAETAGTLVSSDRMLLRAARSEGIALRPVRLRRPTPALSERSYEQGSNGHMSCYGRT